METGYTPSLRNISYYLLSLSTQFYTIHCLMNRAQIFFLVKDLGFKKVSYKFMEGEVSVHGNNIRYP